MSLIQEIKKDQLSARKSKDTIQASILTTLIGEAEFIGKNAGNRESTDEEVVKVIKKFVKNNEEVMRLCVQESVAYSRSLLENEFLQKYLPLELTEEEIRLLVKTRLAKISEISPRLMGKTMAWLKENYGGQYDGKLASQIVKELLK